MDWAARHRALGQETGRGRVRLGGRSGLGVREGCWSGVGLSGGNGIRDGDEIGDADWIEDGGSEWGRDEGDSGDWAPSFDSCCDGGESGPELGVLGLCCTSADDCEPEPELGVLGLSCTSAGDCESEPVDCAAIGMSSGRFSPAGISILMLVDEECDVVSVLEICAW